MLLLLAPVVFLGGCYAAWRVYQSATAGAALLIAVLVLNAITVGPVDIQMLGFHVYPEDLVGLALAAAACARLCLYPSVIRRLKLWLLFFAAILLAFAAGAVSHGLKAAGVEFRQFFYFVTAILYMASFPLRSHTLQALARVWLLGCGALVCLALARWAALLVGIGGAWVPLGNGNPLRVLYAGHALFLAQGVLILLYYGRPVATRSFYLLALSGCVVLLQHRSVWIALFVAIGGVCYREGLFRPFLKGVAALGLLAVIALAAVPQRFEFQNDVARWMVASVEEPFDLDRSSFGWRLLMWQGYVQEFVDFSPAGKLTGAGFGNPGAYQVGETESEASPHNIYIFTVNRAGLLGLAMLVLGYASTWRRLRIPWTVSQHVPWVPCNLLFAILISQLTYFMAYTASPDQGLLVGAMTAVPSLWCQFEPVQKPEAAVAASVA